MAKDDDIERTVPAQVTIKIGNDLISNREFMLYPGTETVYGQGIDLAVSKALATISKVAFDILTDVEGVPENVAAEAMFGKGVQDAG